MLYHFSSKVNYEFSKNYLILQPGPFHPNDIWFFFYSKYEFFKCVCATRERTSRKICESRVLVSGMTCQFSMENLFHQKEETEFHHLRSEVILLATILTFSFMLIVSTNNYTYYQTLVLKSFIKTLSNLFFLLKKYFSLTNQRPKNISRKMTSFIPNIP